jgi:hypothetical protein
MGVLAAKMFLLLARARLIFLRESERDLIVVSQILKPVMSTDQLQVTSADTYAQAPSQRAVTTVYTSFPSVRWQEIYIQLQRSWKAGKWSQKKLSAAKITADKRVSAATDTHATTELLGAVFSMRSVPRLYSESYMVVSPVGLGTNNYCAGECQQQFSSQSADRIKTNDGPNLSSEGAPDIDKTVNVKQ